MVGSLCTLLDVGQVFILIAAVKPILLLRNWRLGPNIFMQAT